MTDEDPREPKDRAWPYATIVALPMNLPSQR